MTIYETLVITDTGMVLPDKIQHAHLNVNVRKTTKNFFARKDVPKY